MTRLLEVRSVTSGYGDLVVLHDINLFVEASEIVAIIGANGAGKSTLLNTIVGLVPVRSGQVIFAQQEISREAPQLIVRRGLVEVPERRQLFPEMSVEENLLLGAYALGGEGRRQAVAAELDAQFALFPLLAERRRQLAATLSGGQQQMLAIARGLMSRPKLLLLDEPSLGLAPLMIEKIFEIVVSLRARGISILVVEQNAHAALGIADRAYIVETGHIVGSGPAAELRGAAQVQDAYLGGSNSDPNAMENRLRRRARRAG